MSESKDFIRSAVLASLKNDRKVCAVTGEDAVGCSDDDGERTNKAGPLPTPPPESAGEQGEENVKKKTKKRKKPGLKLDSNWQALKKVIQKPKRPRHTHMHRQARQHRAHDKPQPASVQPSSATATGAQSAVAEVDKGNASAHDQAAYSAFMSRAVRRNAAVTPIVALDCEMVGVGPGGRNDALARVSVVNFDGDVLYDTFVKPGEAVTDYRTQWSGVRESDVGPNSAAVDAFEAQRVVGALLKGRVVVGHALKNDFKVLRIAHPGQKVRDTSDYYRKLWRRRNHRRPALRVLVAQVLGVDAFQKSEHDSCEDARAALALYKHNAKDWERRVREGGGVLAKRLTGPGAKTS